MSESKAAAQSRRDWEEIKSLLNLAAKEKRRLTAKEARLIDALFACRNARSAYWDEEGRRAERAAKIEALAKRALKGG